MELYFHIPFCVRKCLYCDFLSYPCDSFPEGTMDCYVEALISELKGREQEYRDKVITSVFIGGGTPSILPIDNLRKLLTAIRDTVYGRRSDDGSAEITVECNPGTVDEEKLLLMKSLGVNRLSFGLQSAENTELQRLGRIHSYEQFEESFRLARKLGFDNINIDLMTSVPTQTKESLARTLERVISLRPEHISAYSLIIEEGTPFYDMYEKDPSSLELPDEDTEREMYRVTGEKLKACGYSRYEISNYSLPLRECRHNLGYWTGEEYLGIGLGAASYLREIKSDGAMLRLRNTDVLDEYISAPLKGRTVEEKLTVEELMSEYMILHLRLCGGASRSEFYERFGCSLDEMYREKNEKFIKTGLLESLGDAVRLTQKGFDLANVVMREYL